MQQQLALLWWNNALQHSIQEDLNYWIWYWIYKNEKLKVRIKIFKANKLHKNVLDKQEMSGLKCAKLKISKKWLYQLKHAIYFYLFIYVYMRRNAIRSSFEAK